MARFVRRKLVFPVYPMDDGRVLVCCSWMKILHTIRYFHWWPVGPVNFNQQQQTRSLKVVNIKTVPKSCWRHRHKESPLNWTRQEQFELEKSSLDGMHAEFYKYRLQVIVYLKPAETYILIWDMFSCLFPSNEVKKATSARRWCVVTVVKTY